MKNNIQNYSDEDLLLLSGIQHMAFCERQWALIHIEQAWAENVRTVEGHHLHERVDDPDKDETRGDRLIIRAMPIISRTLGLQGVADVVEFCRVFEKSERSCALFDREGWWEVFPVEYKRGKPKTDDRDAVQLCAQAIALEEMLKISIPSGALYYGQTHRRENVDFSEKLRSRTYQFAEHMHRQFERRITPPAVKGKLCTSCSLTEICQPQLSMKHKPVAAYIRRMLDQKEEG